MHRIILENQVMFNFNVCEYTFTINLICTYSYLNKHFYYSILVYIFPMVFILWEFIN